MPTSPDDFIAPICHAKIDIIYNDDAILVINKPSGLLSLSGKNPLNIDSVHYRLRKIYPQCLMAHRLDFGTSGLMVLALNKATNAHLTRQFQQRSIDKRYLSIVNGHVANKKGVIELPIAKDPPNFPLMKICHTSGKAAISRYDVLDYLNKPARTRLLFHPETGRTHQLRIHSREIGHGILGCDLYGTDNSWAMAERLLLHAYSLSFDHPVSELRMDFICPADF